MAQAKRKNKKNKNKDRNSKAEKGQAAPRTSGRASSARARLAIGVVGVAVIAGVAIGFRSQLAERLGLHTPPPNIVFISIDTLRADHLGTYGYARATSPNIDRLATEGVLFERANAQWPKTGPSVASIMSSTYASVNGCRRLHTRLDDRVTMLAEVVAEAGYYNAAFVANVNIGPYFNFTQGFHEAHEMWDTSKGPQLENSKATFLSNTQITDRVVHWLKGNQERPFMLWVHYLDPHGPYIPSEARFQDDDIFAAQPHQPPDNRLPRYQRAGNHRTVAEYVAAYDAEIVDVDRSVGRILSELKSLGLDERSIIVLTSDHGESLGEHNYWFNHGQYLYQACAHVPLILRYPERLPAGRRHADPIEMLDLAPTIVDLAGIDDSPLTEQFQGASRANLFTGASADPRPVFMESVNGQAAVILEGWKLIVDPRPSTPAWPVPATEQLYNLTADPAETDNVIARYPEVASELRGMLRSWMRRMRDPNAAAQGANTGEGAIDPEMLDMLRSLGYVDDGGDPTEGDLDTSTDIDTTATGEPGTNGP